MTPVLNQLDRPSGRQPNDPRLGLTACSPCLPAVGQYTLYNYFRSSASWRVRIAMHLKGIPFAYHAVNLVKSEQLADEYTKMNPQRKVPTLVIGDGKKTISQSLAIIDYLEHAHPEATSLFPTDPCQRQQAAATGEPPAAAGSTVRR